MTDPRRLLARLNPTTVRYDVGRGGIPELTAQDIAAALAFVPDGLGREVLCALWWPDGACLSRRSLIAAVTRLVGEEWRRQAQALADARVDLGIAQALAGWHGRTSDEQRRNIERAQAAFDEAKAGCWPVSLPQRLPALIQAVITELAAPNLCPICGGEGYVFVEALRAECAGCEGRGSMPVSDRQRAERLGCDEAAFRRSWVGPYSHILSHLADAEIIARGQFKAALRT
jgi:hypothetical protein